MAVPPTARTQACMGIMSLCAAGMPLPMMVAAAAAVATNSRLGRGQSHWIPPPALRPSKRNLALYKWSSRTNSFSSVCPREVVYRCWERTEDVFVVAKQICKTAADLERALLAAGVFWLKTGMARPNAIGAGLHKTHPRYSQVMFKVAAVPCGYGPPKRRKGTWIILDSFLWRLEPSWIDDIKNVAPRKVFISRIMTTAESCPQPPSPKRPRMAISELIT